MGSKEQRISQDFNLLVSAAHDIKTPLSFIKNASSSLLGADMPEEYRRIHIERINIMSGRMLKMIDAVIGSAKARNHRLELEPVNAVDAIYQSYQDVCGYAASIGIDIHISHSRNLPLVYAHRLSLRRVLFNLMDNAIRYSTSRQPVIVSARQEKGRVRISVRDRGVGISKSDYKKIFTMFGSAAAPSVSIPNSSGLGLFIASELCRLMNGELSVSSSGAGSNFILRLPSARQLSLFL